MEIDYSAVLADLKARRDKLDAAIEAIGQIIGSGALAESGALSASPSPGAITEDAFFGMSILDAATKYLAIVKKPQTAAEIAEALERGGFTHSSKSFDSSVYTMLKREHDRDGEITKIGRSKWALASWYPGRKTSQKRPASESAVPSWVEAAEGSSQGPDDSDLLDPTEPEPLDEQSPLDAQE